MNPRRNPSSTNTGRIFSFGMLVMTLLLGLTVQRLQAGDQVPFRASFSAMAESTLQFPFLYSTVTGEGNVTRMGVSSLLGVDVASNLITQQIEGDFTITGANGDKLVIHSQQSARYLDETFETLLFKGTWTVVSGTGRFAGATGGGGVRGWWVFSNHKEEPAIGETVFQGTISSVGGTKR